MTETAFRFDNVSVVFRSRKGGEVAALDGFGCEGEAGKVTCLLGPTGCGKTTALRLMASLENPHSGTALLGGSHPKLVLDKIGYVSQYNTLLPWLRLDENVAFPLRMRGEKRKARIDSAHRLLAQVGLDGSARLYPHECSGGMQQRAILARLLASGASHWLLDEPLAALDEPTRYAIQELILKLQREAGLSVLLVTHSVEEAVFLADRIYVLSLRPGKVVRQVDLSLSRPRDRLGDEFNRVMQEVRNHLCRILV